MLVAPSRDGNVFKQILAAHWDGFTHAHPRDQTADSHGLVAKLLDWGNPDKRGSIDYRGLHWGQGQPLVAMRCQASLCWRCAQVYVDPWGSHVSTMLHAGVLYRPLILTVPALFRTTFDQHAAVVLSAFMRCGAHCLDDCSSTVRGKALKGGAITVLHPQGRHGQDHPHLHLLATSGGYAAPGARWEHLQYVPDDLLRRTWPWHLLTMLRQRLKTDALKRLVDPCFRQYPDGLVTHGQQGTVPSRSQSVARYGATDVVSPPLAGRRLARDDGARGPSHDRSHRTDRVEHATVDVDPFIGRLVPHTRPKGGKRIRSYGVQATKTCAQVTAVIQAALAQVEGVVRGAVTSIARLTYRQRDAQSTGRDPLICPHCQGEMEVWRIGHPTYGVIYDEGEVIKRGTYASTVQRAGP